jgi:1-deoxy-D-xylulose-5-phosphate reductoisomerase
MKKIALIGSTGSIGRQAIDVVQRHSDKFKIVLMVASSSYELFYRQINDLTPEYAVMTDVQAAKKLGDMPKGVRLYSGAESAIKCLKECSADVVLVACGGFAGLEYSLATVACGKRLALANKETLVCGGDLVMPYVKDIAPVDSEHSAIWQCLNYNRQAKLKNLIITASGGPFKNIPFDQLKNITPQVALNHPTWKMGKKITIDSATLLNKGYEVIEAHHLYGTPYKNIKTVIQPQSIIHSMVEFDDGAILAQMSNPTMELPIQLALTYPERFECNLTPMDFTKAFSIEFMPLVRGNYPLYDLALTCGESGGVLPTALNAASEVAVYAFLNGQIAFTDIYKVAQDVVLATPYEAVKSFEQLKEVDRVCRLRAEACIKGI